MKLTIIHISEDTLIRVVDFKWRIFYEGKMQSPEFTCRKAARKLAVREFVPLAVSLIHTMPTITKWDGVMRTIETINE